MLFYKSVSKLFINIIRDFFTKTFWESKATSQTLHGQFAAYNTHYLVNHTNHTKHSIVSLEHQRVFKMPYEPKIFILFEKTFKIMKNVNLQIFHISLRS